MPQKTLINKRFIVLIAAIILLVGALVVMSKANDDGKMGVTTGVEHDHDGDGKPDH